MNLNDELLLQNKGHKQYLTNYIPKKSLVKIAKRLERNFFTFQNESLCIKIYSIIFNFHFSPCRL